MNAFLKWARTRQGMIILGILVLFILAAIVSTTVDGGLAGAAGFIRPTRVLTPTPIP